MIFVANSDEEQSGDWGMGWLIKNHPELIKAEFALNEGGRTRIVGGKRLYVAVQNTEKVPHTVTVTARGPGGHASIPLAGNAILRLGRALAKIGDYKEPVQVQPDDARVLRASSSGVAERAQERRRWPTSRRRDTRRVAARRARAGAHPRVRRGAPQRHLGHDHAGRHPHAT